MRMKRGVGVTEDGEKDKYTALESIARRVSEQAIAEANESFADGTAFPRYV